jgi:hypothetical protein
MPKIQVLRKYQKLLNSHNDIVKTATLLHVEIIRLEELPKVFLAYDTDNRTGDLPKHGKYLMLIFLKEREDYTTALNLFTTLRAFTPEKYFYYAKKVGKVFQVVT